MLLGLTWDNVALGISNGVGCGLAIGSAIGAALDQQNTDKDGCLPIDEFTLVKEGGFYHCYHLLSRNPITRLRIDGQVNGLPCI